MAIFRPGPLVGNISGNLGSINFVFSSRGTHVRRARNTTNRKTKAQLTRTALANQAHTEWNKISASLQTAWKYQAQTLLFKNRLGIPRRLSPFQLFLKFFLQPQILPVNWQTYTPRLIQTAPPQTFQVIPHLITDWQGFTTPDPAGDEVIANVQISRPHRFKQLTIYKNWFTIIPAIKSLNPFLIYDPDTEDPRLQSVVQFEILAFRVRWVRNVGNYQGIQSAPLTTFAAVRVP
jgi:hypothetical protein